ncbi:hypothetical protein M6D93_12440 [Jatrophihabitans telluris]|uniref:Uncharacterized protein n=1 Tax=Jatrophihabitans telluris TaxID=2038343 RepID=A0ABY4QTV0_9ACTN|nr:hypothetical protein [Jatrophihabitans telluris]UQX87109.1 hypothetical protein M6D93_12440 [Jatrophihabitans telluris]
MGGLGFLLLMNVANAFQRSSDESLRGAQQIASRLAADARLSSDTSATDSGGETLPTPVAATNAPLAVSAEAPLLLFAQNEIDQDIESQRWAIGGAGAAALFGIGGLVQMVRAWARLDASEGDLSTDARA